MGAHLSARLLATVLLVAPVPAQDPLPDEAPLPGAVLTDEQWMEVRMQDAPVGWMQTRVWNYEERGAERRLLESMLALKMGRLGGTFQMQLHSREWCEGDESFLRAESVLYMAENPTVQTAVLDGDVVRMRSELMGRVTESEVDWNEGTLGALALSTAMLDFANEPEGATASLETFDPTLGSTTVLDMTHLGAEMLEHDGSQVSTRVVRTESELMPGLSTLVWFSEDGESLRIEQPLMPGLDMTMLHTTRERALQATGKGAATLDVFAELVVTCEPRIPRPRRVDEALLHLKVKDAAHELPDFGFDARQVEESRDADGVVLRISRRDPPPGRAARPLRSPAPELEEFLVATDFLQCDDAALAAAAREAVGDETDAWTAAQILETWVYEHVDEKSMDVGFASAAETFENRTGDCSEHAALHAAMCRAVGIPSRVVMGYLYFNGVLGGHAWNEVWIDGDWYALDATTAYGSVDATHLAVGTSSYGEDGADEMFDNLRQALGNLDVEVLELRYGETRVDLREGMPNPLDAEGDYHDPILGLAFAMPSGWSYEASEAEGMSTRTGALWGPEREARMTIDAQAVPSGFELDELPGVLARDPENGPVSLLVDERDAILYRDRSGSKQVMEVFVLDDDVLFGFRLRAPATSIRTLTALLRSVDFDV